MLPIGLLADVFSAIWYSICYFSIRTNTLSQNIEIQYLVCGKFVLFAHQEHSFLIKKKQTMKIRITVIFLLFTQISIAQRLQIINIDNRNTFSLNGEWNYIINPSGRDLSRDVAQMNRAQLNEYDYNHAPTMDVPGAWNNQADCLMYYENSIWLKKTFRYKLEENRRLFLYFGASNYETLVFLNGEEVGFHVGGFTPFNYEITDRIKEADTLDNQIIVEVNNKRRPDAVPAIKYDWWNYGGITRDVYLVDLPATFVQNYHIQLEAGNKNTIAGWLRLNGSNAIQEVTIEIPEVGISEKVKTNEDGFARFDFKARNMVLWTPKNPKLYKVIIRSKADVVEDMIGFRTIEVKDNNILLNGEPIRLRGIAMHDEIPQRRSRTITPEDSNMMLTWAKELNCNFLRLINYPHNENTIRLADKMGFLVWSEIPVTNDVMFDDSYVVRIAKEQLKEAVERDRNRASVILWSVANNTETTSERNSFLKSMINYTRNLDPTRLLTTGMQLEVLDQHSQTVTINDPLIEEVDVIGLNQYLGWYKYDGFDGLPGDCRKAKWKINSPKPIVVSEFGAGALKGFHGDSITRWSEEFQQEVYKYQLEMLPHVPNFAGSSAMCLADFRSPRAQNPVYQQFYNRKGLISETGQKKKSFFLLKKFYDQMEIQHK